MKIFPFVATTVLLAGGTSAFAADHHNKLLTALEPPHAGKDCIYFKLSGVTQADSVVTGEPWFAIPRAATGFSEIYSLLLAARLSGAEIHVSTNGTLASGCGTYALATTAYFSD